jgi:hypothetical protein
LISAYPRRSGDVLAARSTLVAGGDAAALTVGAAVLQAEITAVVAMRNA